MEQLLVGLGHRGLGARPSVRTILPPSLVAVSVPPPMVASTALPLPAVDRLADVGGEHRARAGSDRSARRSAGARFSGLASNVPAGALSNAASVGHQHGVGTGAGQRLVEAGRLGRGDELAVWPEPGGDRLVARGFLGLRSLRAGCCRCRLSSLLQAPTAAAIGRPRRSRGQVCVMPLCSHCSCSRNGPATRAGPFVIQSRPGRPRSGSRRRSP